MYYAVMLFCFTMVGCHAVEIVAGVQAPNWQQNLSTISYYFLTVLSSVALLGSIVSKELKTKKFPFAIRWLFRLVVWSTVGLCAAAGWYALPSAVLAVSVLAWSKKQEETSEPSHA